MDCEPTDEGAGDGARESGDEIPRSVFAALAGMAIAAAMLWLTTQVLHPNLWAMLVGATPLCAVTPGFVIGLIDRRRPVVTAPVAAFLFYLCTVTGVGWRAVAGPGFVVVAGTVSVVALLGALVAARVRGRPYRVAAVLAVLAAIFTVALVVPEMHHRRDAARFVRHRLSDVLAFVSDDLVRVPEHNLQWRREIVGGFLRGVELKTAWRAATKTAGAGTCTLEVLIGSVDVGDDLRQHMDGIQFDFAPDGPIRLQKKEEAVALLQELGVQAQPPEGLEEQALPRWRAWWRPYEGKRPWPIYEVGVAHDGRVMAKRKVPFLD